jgi:maltooligosyltrehalose trehalohydrolase
MLFIKEEIEKKNQPERYFPVGAELKKDIGVNFRVWAPAHKNLEVALLENYKGKLEVISTKEMNSEPEGFFSLQYPEARENTLYKFRTETGELFPDPASRFQPYGPEGPSQIVDSESFTWTDNEWKGVQLEGQIFYEMHIGTFTREGSFMAAINELPQLSDLGITCIELMPVADFCGNFGWGYDGVNLFAPTRLYGSPDHFKKFVDEAHKSGLGVILDVVYNHLGPDGNYLKKFSEYYFTQKHKTDWGEAINFDDEHSSFVREYFITNARYWIKEYHIDGLRLDATQDIHDDSAVHILKEITDEVRKEAGKRSILIIGENEPQDTILIKAPEEGGFGIDAVWNDDFHHSAMVAITGHNEAYYTDYNGTPQEFISSAKYGFLYQGQRYKWQKKRRGTPSLRINPQKFINFIQNHDQVANSAKGLRANQLANFGLYKTMTSLLFLSPGTPMLFQGEEFAASSPFLYFADQKKEIAEMVKKGRSEFLAQFRSLATLEMQLNLPDPSDENSFILSKLNFSEREEHKHFYQLHKDLIRIRKKIITPFVLENKSYDGAVLSDNCFLLRYFLDDNDWLTIFNIGKDLHLNPAPEPLLAPPENKEWDIYWSTEESDYLGYGTPAYETEENWRITGYSAAIFISTRIKDEKNRKNN